MAGLLKHLVRRARLHCAGCPWLIELLPRHWHPSIQWRGVPLLTGLTTTSIQLMAGKLQSLIRGSHLFKLYILLASYKDITRLQRSARLAHCGFRYLEFPYFLR